MAAPRWLLRARTPYNWDSVNFSFAVEQIDLTQHRPHQPIAIGFVLAGRLLRPLFGGDAHAALIAANVVFAVASCVLIFAFAYSAAPDRRNRHGWLAWLVFASSVQHAFNSCVAEVYMSELATTLAAAVCLWSALSGSVAALFCAAICLAVAGAFRLTGMLFLLPLAGFVFLRAPQAWRFKWVASLLFVAAVAAWAVPLLASVGAGSYFEILWQQFAGSTRAHWQGFASTLNRHLRDTLYSLLTGAGLTALVSLPLLLTCVACRLPRRMSWTFGVVWFAPAFLFFSFVHFGKAGYTLMLLAPVALALSCLYAQIRSRAWLTLLVASHLLVGSVHFLWGSAPTGAAIGEGKRYRDKTLMQKLLTESRSILSTGAPELRAAERELELARAAVARACPEPDSIALVAGDDDGFNWRRAMYSFPEQLAVRVPRSGAQPLFLGKRGRFEVRVESALVLRGICAAVWLVPESAPLALELRAQAVPQDASSGWPFVTRGPATISLAPGTRLVLE